MPRWLPNAISVLRLCLVPAWLWAAEAARAAAASGLDPGGPRRTATLVLLGIGLSDVLDGWLARRFGLATRTGATLDAVADKLCQVALVTWLTVRAPQDGPGAFTPLPLWFMLLLIARDGTLLVAFLVLRRRVGTVQVVHRYHGKLASVLLFVLLLGVSAHVADAWMTPTLLLIAATVLLSTVAYGRDGARQLRHAAAPAGGGR